MCMLAVVQVRTSGASAVEKRLPPPIETELDRQRQIKKSELVGQSWPELARYR